MAGVPKDPVPQLGGPGEVEGPPRAVLAAVPELLVGVGEQFAGGGVRGVGEDHVIEYLGHPAQVTVVVGLPGPLHDRVGATHELHVALRALHRRVRPQVRGVAVEPAQVALVDRLDVVAHRSVVAVRGPGVLEGRWQLQLLGDLVADQSLVEQSQRLVVEVAVEVALDREELHDALRAPGGPVVRRERDVGPPAEQVDRLGEVRRPGVGVAHERAPQGEQVVQGVGGVLGQAQGAAVGEEEVHLGRGLGAGRQLEDHPHAVDRSPPAPSR